MNRETALLVIHARMLGASFRRIAELFGEDPKQSTGMNMVKQAAAIIGVDVAGLESASFAKSLDNLHIALGVTLKNFA